MQLSILTDENQQKNVQNLRHKSCKKQKRKFAFKYTLWHSRLWSFQGRDTKLERFLAKNQLYSNEITKF